MAYTDWTNHLHNMSDKQELNILEFGLGVGTLSLVNEFKSVYSFEINNNDEWFNKTKETVERYSNWAGEFVLAESLIQKHKEFAQSGFTIERDTQELEDILEDSKSRVNYADYEVFFIDAGVYFRGEIVNFCFQFEPRHIMIHDANGIWNGAYGYNLCIHNDEGEPRANNPNYKLEMFTGRGEDGTGLFTRKE